MSVAAIGSGAMTTQLSARRLVGAVGLALALGYLIVLSGAYLGGQFLLDAQGRPIANDFVNVYAAGKLVDASEAAAAYDWPVHKAAEIGAVGHDFANYYGWHYPPTFLFVAAALATLPYLAALLVWLVATLIAYAASVAAILGSRAGIALALGFPAALWNVTAGQNGFLTATLIGGTLGLLERHPALAGVCLGLLTYKPQFGLLFPIVLIAERRLLTIAVAAAVAAALGAASWLAFGTASWAAFIHATPAISHAALRDGAIGFARMQSPFGLVRTLGGGEALAWTVQAAATLSLALALALMWRSRAAYDLKAAALAAGALVATPYVFTYDLVVLAVAVAFLLRYALFRGLWVSEAAGVIAAGALILSFPYLTGQVGLCAAVIVVILAGRRALMELDAGDNVVFRR
jgi:hypothetical protein